jgi:hypothetical protein
MNHIMRRERVVLLALLEGDTMYVDVMMQTLYWTGFISKKDRIGRWGDIPPTRLTPDQNDHPYVKAMAEGPLLLLLEMTKYGFAEALWAAMRNSEFYHLLIQRLLRLIAREVLGTRDGLRLAPMARKVLPKLCDVEHSLLSDRVAKSVAEKIIRGNAATVLSSPEAVTRAAVEGLLHQE